MAYTSKNPRLDSVIITDAGTGGSVANPASGSYKILNRAGTFKSLSSSGVERSLGSGAGEKNYLNDSDVIGNTFVASGSGVTVANTTTTAELPEVSKAVGIKITGVSGTDYVRARWTIDAADKGKNLKIYFNLKTAAAYTSNDFKVEVYTNSASNYGGSYTALTVQTSSQVPKNDAGGTISYSFNTDATADYYELRITRVTGTSYVVISGVIVGPGTVGLAPAVSGANSYTLTIGATTTPPTQGSGASKSATWWRVGSKMRLQFEYTQTNAGSAGSGTYLFPLPSGYTIDTSLFQAGSIGSGGGGAVGACQVRSSGTQYYGTVQVYNTTNLVMSVGDSASNLGVVGSGNNNLGTAVTYYSFEAEVPITEWASSGTLNVLAEDNLSVWTDFTPTFIGQTSGTMTLTAGFEAQYRRLGQNLEIRFSGAFSALATGNMQMTLPFGHTVPASSPDLLNSSLLSIGSGTFLNGSNIYAVLPAVNSSTQIAFMTNYNITDSSGSRLRNLGAGDPTVNTDFLSFSLSVPVTAFANSTNAIVGFSNVSQNASGLVKSAGQLLGTNTNDTASAGYVGELMTATEAGTSVTANTTTNIASLTLTAGCWDVSGVGGVTRSGGGTLTSTWQYVSISTTSATQGGSDYEAVLDGSFAGDKISLATPTRRVTVASGATQNVYLVLFSNFSGTTANKFGGIRATRVR